MTTASDARLRQCDWASCKSVATTERGGYDFCATHLAEHNRIEAGDDPEGEPVPDEILHPRANGHGTLVREQQHRRDGETPCRLCLDAARQAQRERTAARPAGPPPPAPLGGSTGQLLDQAAQHSNARIRRLGEKATRTLDELRALIAQHAEAERQRQQAAAEREAARAEVSRLEQQLAAARRAARTARGGTPANRGNRSPRTPAQREAAKLNAAKARAAKQQARDSDVTRTDQAARTAGGDA